MKTFDFKNFEKGIWVFCFVLLSFGLMAGKSIAQTTRPDSITNRTPNNPAHPATMHNPYQKPDTSIGKGVQAKPKLTAAQLKKIVGNDKPIGKDSQGHQLYEDANGKQYYVNDSGTKVYVK